MHTLKFSYLVFVNRLMTSQLHHITCQESLLRSANKNLLAVPSSRTILADRAFSRAAPTVWNALPSSVTSVKPFLHSKKLSKPIYFSWPTTHNPEVSASESGLSAQNYGAI